MSTFRTFLWNLPVIVHIYMLQFAYKYWYIGYTCDGGYLKGNLGNINMWVVGTHSTNELHHWINGFLFLWLK